MQYLSAVDILEIHAIIVSETGGSHGVRDRHALQTLQELSQQSAFGKELYSDMYVKAALYVRNIIFSHPFVDGNKRTAVTSADVFLQLNGWHISCKKGDVEAFALRVVAEHLELDAIAAWLKKKTRRSRKVV